MDLTDEQWEVLEPLIPVPARRADGKGRPWRDPSYVLNGILLWVLRTGGAPWRDLPERYPPYQTCHRRFERWTEEGVLEDILRALAEDLKERGGLDLSECFIDGTFVGAKKGEGRWERPSGAKVYEAHGVGRRFWSSSRRTRGERFATRGHPRRSDARGELRRRGTRAADRRPGLRFGPAGWGSRRTGHRDEMIAPPRRNRKKRKTQDGRKLRRYKRRWKIERLFAWLSSFRRLVVRYKRRVDNYLGFVKLGCIVILLRHL